MEIFWKDYMFEAFGENPGKVDKRRRSSALDLWGVRGPVKIDGVRRISAKVAEQYSGKSTRTIKRDIESLIEKDLIEEQQGGYSVNRKTLLRFLPVRAVSD